MRAFIRSMRRQLWSCQQGPTYLWFLVRVFLRYPHMLANAVRMAIMGYHFEKITHYQVAVDDFKQYLTSELDTFQNAVARFGQAQSNRIGNIADRTRDLLAHGSKQYDDIHEDFRYGAQEALEVFQQSVFNHYLEAELHCFKEAVARFTKAPSDQVGETSVYVHNLFNRVHTQYAQLHHEVYDNVQDELDTFRKAIKHHLEQGFGPCSNWP